MRPSAPRIPQSLRRHCRLCRRWPQRPAGSPPPAPSRRLGADKNPGACDDS